MCRTMSYEFRRGGLVAWKGVVRLPDPADAGEVTTITSKDKFRTKESNDNGKDD